jgi:hypothetical protein
MGGHPLIALKDVLDSHVASNDITKVASGVRTLALDPDTFCEPVLLLVLSLTNDERSPGAVCADEDTTAPCGDRLGIFGLRRSGHDESG